MFKTKSKKLIYWEVKRVYTTQEKNEQLVKYLKYKLLSQIAETKTHIIENNTLM